MMIAMRLETVKGNQYPFSMRNERGDILGVAPEYIVSWRAFDVEDEWQAVFSLPPGGEPPPERET